MTEQPETWAEAGLYETNVNGQFVKNFVNFTDCVHLVLSMYNLCARTTLQIYRFIVYILLMHTLLLLISFAL